MTRSLEEIEVLEIHLFKKKRILELNLNEIFLGQNRSEKIWKIYCRFL